MSDKAEQSSSSSPDSEWEDIDVAGEEDDEESINLSIKTVKSKRGRKLMPEMWSRVICLGADDLKNLRTFELAPDLLMGNAMKATVSRGKQAKKYKFLFWPDHYVKEGHSLKLEDNQLTDA